MKWCRPAALGKDEEDVCGQTAGAQVSVTFLGTTAVIATRRTPASGELVSSQMLIGWRHTCAFVFICPACSPHN